MAHKTAGGWLVEGKLFAQIKVANELWYNTLKNDEKVVHLFSFGWTEMEEHQPHKLYTLIILWISIKIGV